MSQSVLDLADVKSRMLVIRNQPVLLDRDVAELYGVETRVVNQAVKRNLERFPEGYILELTSDECPRSQILTLNGKPLPLLLSPASTPPVRRPRQRPLLNQRTRRTSATRILQPAPSAARPNVFCFGSRAQRCRGLLTGGEEAGDRRRLGDASPPTSPRSDEGVGVGCRGEV